MEKNRALMIEVIQSLMAHTSGERHSERTDVGLWARTTFVLVWEAGRLTLSEPDEFPPARIISFARELAGRIGLESRPG